MKRIAVLRGGPSEEYDVSMLSGNAVLAALADTEYQTKDIMISKAGDWYHEGRKRTPNQALEGIDVVFIALHGSYGEDGQVQRILEQRNIPFTGSPSLASGIAFNKELTKHTLRPHGINMAKHRKVRQTERATIKDEVAQIIADLGTEVFIKPLASGSSFGVRKVRETTELYENLVELLDIYDNLLVEEYIGGTEATVGVLSDFRGERLYSLPVIEIVPPTQDGFYTAANKYDGTSDHICPGRFSQAQKNEMARIAKLAHIEVGCDQYSRTDFLVRGNEIFFLEINTLPGFTGESNYPIAADAVGLDFKQLVRHLVDTARV